MCRSCSECSLFKRSNIVEVKALYLVMLLMSVTLLQERALALEKGKVGMEEGGAEGGGCSDGVRDLLQSADTHSLFIYL